MSAGEDYFKRLDQLSMKATRWLKAISKKAHRLGRRLPTRVIASPTLRSWAIHSDVDCADTTSLPCIWPGNLGSLTGFDWDEWVERERNFDDFTFSDEAQPGKSTCLTVATTANLKQWLDELIEKAKGFREALADLERGEAT